MTTNVKTEKRARARASLKVPLPVYEHPSKTLIGHAVDISAGGIGVYSETYQLIDQAQWVSMNVPSRRNNSWQEITLKVEPAWSRYDDTTQCTAIGFKFLEIEPSTLFAIQRLIDDHSSLG